MAAEKGTKMEIKKEGENGRQAYIFSLSLSLFLK